MATDKIGASAPAPNALERGLLGVRLADGPRLLPGLLLAVLVMLGAGLVADFLGRGLLRLQGIDPAGKASPISAITISVLLGIAIANTLGTARVFRPGLDFSVKKILRLGIILVGIKLSFWDVVRLGARGVPVVAAIVVTALVVTTWFARRLGISDRLGILAAASTAICGVTATVAVAPTIDADDQEVAYTIANVTLFGVFAMFTYPYLAHALLSSRSAAVGMFLGTGIHDTSQVMGAALSYKEIFHDETALQVAAVTKLTRNVFLLAVVPLLALFYARRRGGEAKKVTVAKLFPLFVVGFLALAIVRSTGDAMLARRGLAFGRWPAADWNSLTKTIGETWASAALATALAGVGLTTDLKFLRKLGARPLYVGALSAAVVALLALSLAALFGPR